MTDSVSNVAVTTARQSRRCGTHNGWRNYKTRALTNSLTMEMKWSEGAAPEARVQRMLRRRYVICRW